MERYRSFLNQDLLTNLSKGVIEHVRKCVGNRILYLQEVAAKTEALTQKKPTERFISIADRYADEKHIERTGTLGFFLENFETVPPASLF